LWMNKRSIAHKALQCPGMSKRRQPGPSYKNNDTNAQ
jgi:hypothetical protein